MDVKAFPALIVGVVVALVLAGAVLPVFAETTSAEDTFKNDGYYTMDKVATDSDFTISWAYTAPYIINVGGVNIDMSTKNLVSGKAYTVFGGDNFVFRYIYHTTQPYIQCFADQSLTPSFIQATIPKSASITATISNGSVVFATDNEDYPNPITLTLSENTYCINPEDKGAFTMKKADDTVYIVEDTDIIVLDGITSLMVNDVGIFATGTINGDLDASAFRGTATYEVTFSDFEYTTTAVNAYVDLVKLEKVDFIATQNDTDYNVTYSYFIVPTEITAEKVVHPDGALSALLNLLPLLAVAGLVVGAVAWFISRKA